MHDSPEPLKNRPTGQAPDYMLVKASPKIATMKSSKFEEDHEKEQIY